MKTEYKEFNWETAIGSRERIEWIKENSDKKITEAEFVKSWQSLKQFSNSYSNRAKHKRYSPSNAKKNYKLLVEKFGFFI